jgi:hypothetical protein
MCEHLFASIESFLQSGQIPKLNPGEVKFVEVVGKVKDASTVKFVTWYDLGPNLGESIFEGAIT